MMVSRSPGYAGGQCCTPDYDRYHDAEDEWSCSRDENTETNNIPIIILSAKTEETDKVLGLSMGADDYISKPFNTQEMIARVRHS